MKQGPTRVLFWKLSFLTLLFILAQLSFFAIHYQVSELIDSVVHSSLSFEHEIILWPIVQYVGLQVFVYTIGILWIIFISKSLVNLLVLPVKTTNYIAFALFVTICIFLFLLNKVFFPHSFFADFNMPPFSLLVTGGLLGLATIAAYVNWFWKRPRSGLGGFFLLLIGAVAFGFYVEEKILTLPPPQQINEKPNVILIGVDSVRPDFTGYFTHEAKHTPHIDQFLKASQTFENAYTPLARTYPAWVSILTGQHPQRSGARVNLVEAKTIMQHEMLSKRLQQAGYETIYATDEKRFSHITTDYGFDHIVGPRSGVNDFLLGGLTDFPLSNLLTRLPFADILFPYHDGNRAATITYYPDDFLKLLQQQLAKPRSGPLFLAVHLCLSHWPYTWPQDGLTNEASTITRYTGSVRAVDAEVGKLLALLKKAGLLEHSWVVLLSDHGTTMGLPGDRLLTKSHYHGDWQQLSRVSIARKNEAPSQSLDFARDYTLNTSYGQGTDVLSLKQYRVVLGFRYIDTRGSSLFFKPTLHRTPASLLDIAPTLLDLLHLPALSKQEGESLRPQFFSKQSQVSARRIFIETGDSMSEIETDNIDVQKVIHHRIGLYRMHPDTGALSITPAVLSSFIKNKQRAVIAGDWLLARYPSTLRLTLKLSPHQAGALDGTIVPAYFILAHLKTGDWTMNLHHPFAKKAPVLALQAALREFYGDEIE